MEIDPVADFAFGARGFYEAEPIPAGAMALLSENFDHVTAGDFVAQRHHLAVYSCANAVVTDLSVNGVSKIHGSGSGGEFQHAALGSEGIYFVGSEIDF